MMPIITPKMRTMAAATAMPTMTGGSRALSEVVDGGPVAAWGIYNMNAK